MVASDPDLKDSRLWVMGTSMCIEANGQIRFRNQIGRSVWWTCSWRRHWTLEVHKGWAEGPGLSPTGSKVLKWGLVGLELVLA